MTVARLAATLSILGLVLASPASAGLQRWSVVYLDATGQPTTYGKAAAAEAYAFNARGYEVAIGCSPDGGYMMAVTGPEGEAADFAGPEIEPSVRVSKPGTDLFLGPVGRLVFDGSRYVGRVPSEAVSPLKQKIKDGILALTEFTTRTVIKLDTQSSERAMAELRCK